MDIKWFNENQSQGVAYRNRVKVCVLFQLSAYCYLATYASTTELIEAQLLPLYVTQ